MAEGPPYVLDFLQQVINVQFGGQWMCFGIIWNDDKGQNITLEFPGESGGTPGFALIDGGFLFSGSVPAPPNINFPLPPSLAGYPKVKATDLTKKLTTEAGASFNGFGAGDNNSGEGIVLMQAGSGIIPSGKAFPMTGRLVGDNNVALLFGGFVKKNAMKAGPFPTKFASSDGNLPFLFEFNNNVDTKIVHLTVDPVNLTITVD